jgi:hypothetical protein
MRDYLAAPVRHYVIYQISNLFVLKVKTSFSNSQADFEPIRSYHGDQTATAGDLVKMPKNVLPGSGR